MSDEHVDGELDQLGGEGGEPLAPALTPAVFDDQMLPLHVANVMQCLAQCLGVRPGEISEIPYPGELRRRLRLRGE